MFESRSLLIKVQGMCQPHACITQSTLRQKANDL